MKMFANVARLEIGQLFTQGGRQGATAYFGHISSFYLQRKNIREIMLCPILVTALCSGLELFSLVCEKFQLSLFLFSESCLFLFIILFP